MQAQAPLWTPRGFFDAVIGPFVQFFAAHKAANLNIIRNWLGQNTEEVFYELADEYGISAERVRQVEANAINITLPGQIFVRGRGLFQGGRQSMSAASHPTP